MTQFGHKPRVNFESVKNRESEIIKGIGVLIVSVGLLMVNYSVLSKMVESNGLKVVEANPKETIKVVEARPTETIKVETEKNWMIGNFSAYTASADECGNSKGITASGEKVRANYTLACPKQYPFGTVITIEGMGRYTCTDRGGAIIGNKFDIYFKDKKDAFAFGRRNLNFSIN